VKRPKALKEQTRQTKDAITNETLKINAIQGANEKIQTTIDSLGRTQRAWLAKKSRTVLNCSTVLQN